MRASELLRTALESAGAATAVHRRDAPGVRLDLAREKSRADYVSETDLDAQAAALEVIRQRHPDHAVLAEEGAAVAEQLGGWSGGPLWIVDPLDGTANFLHGYPEYAASVAVAVEGRPVAAAVVSGATGERWWASEGGGAFKGGRRITVAQRRGLRDALVGTGFPFKLLDELPDYLGQLDRVLKATSGVRRAGAAALDLCHLAQGSLDAFWEQLLMPWDYAAGWLLVKEAGGAMARIDGSPLGFEPGTVMGGSDPEVLDALRAVLEASSPPSGP